MDVVTEDTKLVGMREDNEADESQWPTPQGCSPQEKKLKKHNLSSFVNGTEKNISVPVKL